jgi:hypothetical protein
MGVRMSRRGVMYALGLSRIGDNATQDLTRSGQVYSEYWAGCCMYSIIPSHCSTRGRARCRCMSFALVAYNRNIYNNEFTSCKSGGDWLLVG